MLILRLIFITNLLQLNMDRSSSSKFIEGLTFDDLLLRPGYSDFKRQEILLETHLTKRLGFLFLLFHLLWTRLLKVLLRLRLRA